MNEPLKKYDEDFISKLGMAITAVVYIQFAKHECLAFRDGDPPISINIACNFDQLCNDTLVLHNFAQISASQCVNLHFLQSYEPTTCTLTLINKKQLEVVAKYQKEAKELFKNPKCPVLRLEGLTQNTFVNKAWVLRVESMNSKTQVIWIDNNNELKTFLSKDLISSILSLLQYYDMRQCNQSVYVARCWVEATVSIKGSRTKELKIKGLAESISLTRTFQAGMTAPSPKNLVQCVNTEFRRLHCPDCRSCILYKT